MKSVFSFWLQTGLMKAFITQVLIPEQGTNSGIRFCSSHHRQVEEKNFPFIDINKWILI